MLEKWDLKDPGQVFIPSLTGQMSLWWGVYIHLVAQLHFHLLAVSIALKWTAIAPSTKKPTTRDSIGPVQETRSSTGHV